MFDWFRRIFAGSEEQKRREFDALVDNLSSRKGKPTVVEQRLGAIPLRSGTLTMGDPQNPLDLEVQNIEASEAGVWVKLWNYSTGAQMVAGLILRFGEEGTVGSRRKIGEVGIDSAKIVLADKADIEEHWAEVGPARIGVISTAPDDTVLRLLQQRFKLKTIQVNEVRAEIVGPVSQSLEKEIQDYLKSKPEYADYLFLYFRLETSNSFDRTLDVGTLDLIPVGNTSEPLMFVCNTGRGDGLYDVYGEFDGDVPRAVSIDFIDEAQE